MKKYFKAFFLLTAILTVFIYTASYAIDSKYQTIKIGLYYGSSAKAQVTVSSSEGFETGYMNSSEFVSLGTSDLTEFTASVSNGGVLVGDTLYTMENGNVAFRPLGGIVNINGTTYRGGVEFIVDSNSLMTVINFVDINDYVAAVVGKEMSPSWHIEALKAQAVCARSYAIRSWNKHSSQGFNLCGTQECQAYLGMSGETESTVRASSETKDQLLMYGNSIAEALYSSSCGGSTGHSKYVWGSDVPYLKAKADPYDLTSSNPRASWSVSFTPAEIKQKLASASVNIGEVTDMKVTGSDEFGRAFEVTIYGTNGEYVLKNDKTRTFLGLYSQKYTISGNVSEAPVLYGITSSGVSALSGNYAQSSQGRTNLNGFVMATDLGTTSYIPTSSQPADKFVLNGSGWGHGLGMSQYGAKARAEDGQSYLEILEFYYEGTYIQ